MAVAPGEVRVFWLHVADVAGRLDALPVTEEERSRAASFRRPEDRARHLAARGMLRALVGREVGLPPASLAFDRTCAFCGGAHGKPRLSGSDVRFSASHSGEIVAVALARGREVGIDVERVEAAMDVEEVARGSLSEGERALLAALPLAGGARARGFFELWTRKEACLKVGGRGLAAPLREVDASAVPPEGGPMRGPDGEVVHVAPLLLAPGYAAAVAAVGGPFQARVERWSL